MKIALVKIEMARLDLLLTAYRVVGRLRLE
jgi:hypothetical protein